MLKVQPIAVSAESCKKDRLIRKVRHRITLTKSIHKWNGLREILKTSNDGLAELLFQSFIPQFPVTSELHNVLISHRGDEDSKLDKLSAVFKASSYLKAAISELLLCADVVSDSDSSKFLDELAQIDNACPANCKCFCHTKKLAECTQPTIDNSVGVMKEFSERLDHFQNLMGHLIRENSTANNVAPTSSTLNYNDYSLPNREYMNNSVSVQTETIKTDADGESSRLAATAVGDAMKETKKDASESSPILDGTSTKNLEHRATVVEMKAAKSKRLHALLAEKIKHATPSLVNLEGNTDDFAASQSAVSDLSQSGRAVVMGDSRLGLSKVPIYHSVRRNVRDKPSTTEQFAGFMSPQDADPGRVTTIKTEPVPFDDFTPDRKSLGHKDSLLSTKQSCFPLRDGPSVFPHGKFLKQESDTNWLHSEVSDLCCAGTFPPCDNSQSNRIPRCNVEPYESHTLAKTRSKTFACEDCGKVFTSPSLLETHRSVHSSERRFQCMKCDARFKQKCSLYTHVRYKHLNIRPFKCALCGKTFPSKKHLTRHTREVHDNIRPFVCELCSKAFANKTNLRVHMRSHERRARYTKKQSASSREQVVQT